MAETVYIALGSNLGDRDSYLSSARDAIAALPLTEVVGVSTSMETEPIGPPDQRRYLNQMIAARTDLEPVILLDSLQRIEDANGRVRTERWGPRTLDLDIVKYGDRVISTDRLTVPHPELPRRDFWLRQLAELEPR